MGTGGWEESPVHVFTAASHSAAPRVHRLRTQPTGSRFRTFSRSLPRCCQTTTRDGRPNSHSLKCDWARPKNAYQVCDMPVCVPDKHIHHLETKIKSEIRSAQALQLLTLSLERRRASFVKPSRLSRFVLLHWNITKLELRCFRCAEIWSLAGYE